MAQTETRVSSEFLSRSSGGKAARLPRVLVFAFEFAFVFVFDFVLDFVCISLFLVALFAASELSLWRQRQWQWQWHMCRDSLSPVPLPVPIHNFDY